MKRSLLLLFCVLGACWFSGSALAQDADKNRDEFGESPRNWTLSAGFGEYRLTHMDDEFKAGTTPFKTVFGDKMRFTFQINVERFVYKGWGTLGLEAASGYYGAKGKGLYLSGAKSGDPTAFHFVPLKGSLVYRFDNIWRDWRVPLVPYGKFGLDSYIWWVSGSSGTSSYNGKKGYGATFGWHAAYGLMFALDFIDPTVAREFDQDVGVNNTYLYIEGIYARVNNFGSSKSWDMTDHHFLAGVTFEF